MKTSTNHGHPRPRRRARTTPSAVLLVAAAWLAPARSFAADVSDADRAHATQLFGEGRAAMARSDYAGACPKLQESQRLDPGGGTLLNLALCHELSGATATALSEFVTAAATARRDARPDREDEALRHMKALEARVARLVIDVPAEARLPGLRVRVDGTAVAEATWGDPEPIDPGPHVVEADAPGRVGWKTTVDVHGDRAHDSVKVPALEPVTAAVPSPAPPSGSVDVPAARAAPVVATRPARAPAGTPSESSEKAPTARAWQRQAAVVVEAAGLAGVAVGVVYGLRASSQWSDAKREGCSNGVCASEAGFQAWSDARSSATVATVAFVAAGAALTGGVVLWLTAPDAKRSVGITAGLGHVTMTGAF